jgi:hypothetical protein
MSKFFVGQSVKKVRDANAGCTATVIEAPDANGVMGVRCDQSWVRQCDGAYMPPGSDAYTHADHWEPLTPPRREEVVTWDAAPFTRDGKWKEVVHA